MGYMQLMPTYDRLSDSGKDAVKQMSDAAREVIKERGFAVLNDDRVAIFDEACAVYLEQCGSHTVRAPS